MANKNHLYYGDNLEVLNLPVSDESVDLVYLDPPFNSNANYNVLFKEHDGAQAASQGAYEFVCVRCNEQRNISGGDVVGKRSDGTLELACWACIERAAL